MEGTQEIDKLMWPVLTAIKRHVKDEDAITEIYNRTYEAIMESMDVNGKRISELEEDNFLLGGNNDNKADQLENRNKRIAELEDEIREMKTNLDASSKAIYKEYTARGIVEAKLKTYSDNNRWVSVGDMPPDLPNWVIIYSPTINGGIPFPGTFDNYFGWLDDLRDSMDAPTHWRFLPEPPEEE